MRTDDENTGLGKTRMDALSDGIFAVALTLLVLEVKPKKIAAIDVWWAELWPQAIAFIASFLIVGTYWIAHHNECRLIRRTDRWLLWLNLLFLLSIVLVPFATGLLSVNWWTDGSQWNRQIPVWVYTGNLILVGLTLEAVWQYAKRRGYFDASLSKSPGKSQIVETTIRNLFAPCLYFIAAMAASVSLGRWLAVVVPFLYIAYLVWSGRRGLLERLQSVSSESRK